MNRGFAQLNIVCGTNGTGKSTRMDEIIKVSPFDNAIVYVESIDLYGKPFAGLPTVLMSKYRGGKVTIDADTIKFPHFIDAIVKHYRNGLLIIDEAGMYKLMDGDDFIPAVKELFKQRRKFNIEIYLVYHGVSEIPVRVIKWCTNFILFHQTDEFKHKGGVIPRIEELKAMQLRIREQYFKGNKYYCEYLQLS